MINTVHEKFYKTKKNLNIQFLNVNHLSDIPEASFIFEINDVDQYLNNFFQTPSDRFDFPSKLEFTVNSIPFLLSCSINPENEEHTFPHIEFAISCLHTQIDENDWSFNLRSTYRILSYEKNIPDLTATEDFIFKGPSSPKFSPLSSSEDDLAGNSKSFSKKKNIFDLSEGFISYEALLVSFNFFAYNLSNVKNY